MTLRYTVYLPDGGMTEVSTIKAKADWAIAVVHYECGRWVVHEIRDSIDAADLSSLGGITATAERIPEG